MEFSRMGELWGTGSVIDQMSQRPPTAKSSSAQLGFPKYNAWG